MTWSSVARFLATWNGSVWVTVTVGASPDVLGDRTQGGGQGEGFQPAPGRPGRPGGDRTGRRGSAPVRPTPAAAVQAGDLAGDGR